MPRSSDPLEVATPLGPARLHVYRPAGGVRELGTLVLGHGAGGGVEAADLVAVVECGTSTGWQVVLVEQPWRVAGKRVAPAPARLDTGWLAALEALAAAGEAPGRLVVGGRSAGARVACRTALRAGAEAVVCLAFPLHPPGRPERSRAAELAAAGVPVLVVQGRRDPFGGPAEIVALHLAGVEVVAVDGDHAFGRGAAGAAAAAVCKGLPGPARARSRGRAARDG